MTLDEAIVRYEEKVREQEEDASKWEYTLGVYRRRDYCDPSTIPTCEKELKRCKKCAEDYRQLAEWLKLLKRILDSGNCNDCELLNSPCRYAPRWGEQVRYNCPFYSKERKSSTKKNNGITKFANTKWG